MLEKTHCSRVEDVRKLNLWGHDLRDVSIVRRMPLATVLSLSVNEISDLRDFVACPNLQELYLRKNRIEDLTSVALLSVRDGRPDACAAPGRGASPRSRQRSIPFAPRRAGAPAPPHPLAGRQPVCHEPLVPLLCHQRAPAPREARQQRCVRRQRRSRQRRRLRPTHARPARTRARALCLDLADVTEEERERVAAITDPEFLRLKESVRGLTRSGAPETARPPVARPTVLAHRAPSPSRRGIEDVAALAGAPKPHHSSVSLGAGGAGGAGGGGVVGLAGPSAADVAARRREGRPRNAILSAVLMLLPELDAASLELVRSQCEKLAELAEDK